MSENSQIPPPIPSSIWALGSVSFFTKVSATIVFTASPLFVTKVFGASAFTVGILEGMLEVIVLLSRVFSGVLSDLIHRRKTIIAIGYVFALISRPFLALAGRVEDVFIGRALDRIANGLDATPRDALVGDLAPPQIKGACYGLRESLSRAGSCCGAIMLSALLWLTAENFSLIFWIGSIPVVLAMIVLMLFVKDPTSEKYQQKKVKKKFNFNELLHLPLAFWLTLLLSGLFMLSNFSGAFLILRVEQTGLALHLIPIVMIIQNFATAGTAYPVGYLSDKMGRRSMMALGILFVIISDLFLALGGESVTLILIGVLLWGIEIGITQSILAVLLADACPEDVRGTGFGLFHFINGVCLLFANILAGWIWHGINPSTMFYASAVVAVCATLVLPFIKQEKRVRNFANNA